MTDTLSVELLETTAFIGMSIQFTNTHILSLQLLKSKHCVFILPYWTMISGILATKYQRNCCTEKVARWTLEQQFQTPSLALFKKLHWFFYL